MKFDNKRHLIATIVLTSFTILFNIFIITQSCLNGNQSTVSSGFVVELIKSFINAFSKDVINESNIDILTSITRKAVGHFGLFMISGILTSWSIHLLSKYIKKYQLWFGISFSLFFGLFLAGLTELIQRFVPGRSGEFTDVLIDYGGYLLGASIIIVIVLIMIKNHNKEERGEIL